MTITYPHTIESIVGEKLTFVGIESEPDGDRLLVRNEVAPGAGPMMHNHLQ